MSVKCQTWVWEHSKTTGNDRLLLLAIADCADDEGDNAWPGIPKLADKATCSERTVQRRIQELEKAGCLVVIRGGGPYGTHRYRVLMDDGAKKTPKRPRPAPAAASKPVDNTEGGDKLSPPQPVDDGGVKLSPGVTQLCRAGGDTQVSPERPERPSTPQPPRRAGGRRCTHGKTSGCRPCGTSPRAQRLAEAADQAAAIAEHDRQRAAVRWCEACEQHDRWREVEGRGYARCPDCHPDLVVGPALRPPPAATGRAGPRPASAPQLAAAGTRRPPGPRF